MAMVMTNLASFYFETKFKSVNIFKKMTKESKKIMWKGCVKMWAC